MGQTKEVGSLKGLQAGAGAEKQPRRPAFRRHSKPPVVWRAQFVRSDVRRGPQATLTLLAPLRPRPLSPAAFHERLMTLRLQAAIAAAMIGMSLFFRGPLQAALLGLFQ